MKNFLILIILISFNAYSISWEELKNKTTDAINDLRGVKEKEPEKDLESTVKLPKIPKIVKSAVDSKVFNKKSSIYDQGKAYTNLPFSERQKYELAFIKEAYLTTRKSEAKREDLIQWLNVIEQGGTREGVYRSIVLDDIYYGLERYDEKINKECAEFVQHFLRKFIGSKVKVESLSKINLYTLKKAVAEKSLEIIDTMIDRPKDVYAWYAIMSSDLAKQFKHAFKKKTRSVDFPEFHEKWAKSVPLQHIKSEVVLKIHIAMNSFK